MVIVAYPIGISPKTIGAYVFFISAGKSTPRFNQTVVFVVIE
jgi:hypothetical protein